MDMININNDQNQEKSLIFFSWNYLPLCRTNLTENSCINNKRKKNLTNDNVIKDLKVSKNS